jgi:hypothetical protein
MVWGDYETILALLPTLGHCRLGSAGVLMAGTMGGKGKSGEAVFPIGPVQRRCLVGATAFQLGEGGVGL